MRLAGPVLTSCICKYISGVDVGPQSGLGGSGAGESGRKASFGSPHFGFHRFKIQNKIWKVSESGSFLRVHLLSFTQSVLHNFFFSHWANKKGSERPEPSVSGKIPSCLQEYKSFCFPAKKRVIIHAYRPSAVSSILKAPICHWNCFAYHNNNS